MPLLHTWCLRHLRHLELHVEYQYCHLHFWIDGVAGDAYRQRPYCRHLYPRHYHHRLLHCHCHCHHGCHHHRHCHHHHLCCQFFYCHRRIILISFYHDIMLQFYAPPPVLVFQLHLLTGMKKLFLQEFNMNNFLLDIK